MVWCRTGDKPLRKPIMTQFTDAHIHPLESMRFTHWGWFTHICVGNVTILCLDGVARNKLKWKFHRDSYILFNKMHLNISSFYIFFVFNGPTRTPAHIYMNYDADGMQTIHVYPRACFVSFTPANSVNPRRHNRQSSIIRIVSYSAARTFSNLTANKGMHERMICLTKHMCSQRNIDFIIHHSCLCWLY